MSETEQENPGIEPDQDTDPDEDFGPVDDDADDDDQAADTADDLEPAPEQATEARLEEISKKLDGLNRHVAKRLGEILGEDATLYLPCELCSAFQTPGWRPPMEPPSETVSALWHLLGQHAPSDYQPDQHSQVCRECNGFGEVATGSKVQGQTHLVCTLCQGRGWTATDEKRQTAAGYPVNGVQPPVAGSSDDHPGVPSMPAEDADEVERLRSKGYLVVPMTTG